MMLCVGQVCPPTFQKINVSSSSESQWRYHSPLRWQELFNQLHIPEDLTINQQHCENLKSCRYYACWTFLTYVLYINQFLIQFIYAPRQPLDIVKMCYTGIFNFDCAEIFLHILKLTFLALCIHHITIYISMYAKFIFLLLHCFHLAGGVSGMSVWSMEYASMAHHSQNVIQSVNPQNSRNNWSSDDNCASRTFQLAGACNLTSPFWN